MGHLGRVTTKCYLRPKDGIHCPALDGLPLGCRRLEGCGRSLQGSQEAGRYHQGAARRNGGQCGNLLRQVEIRLASLEAGGEVVRTCLGPVRVHARLLAGLHLLPQFLGAQIPMGNLLGEPVPHRGPHLGHAGNGLGADLGQVLGDADLHSMVKRPPLQFGPQPRLVPQALQGLLLLRRGSPVVQVGGIARGHYSAVLSDVHELEPPGDHGAPRRSGVAIGDRVFQEGQHVGDIAVVGIVDQDAATTQQDLVTLQCELEDCLEQGVTGSQQLRRSLVLRAHQMLFEGDPLVAPQHGTGAADWSGPSPDRLGNVHHLEASRLPLGHPAPQPLKGILEPGPHVVGLQSPGLCLSHVPADPLDVAGVHDVGGQAVLGDQLRQALTDALVHNPVEAGSDVRLVPVADGFHQQLP